MRPNRAKSLTAALVLSLVLNLILCVTINSQRRDFERYLASESKKCNKLNTNENQINSLKHYGFKNIKD